MAARKRRPVEINKREVYFATFAINTADANHARNTLLALNIVKESSRIKML